MLVIRCSIDVSLATVQFQVTGPNKTMEAMADKKIAHENDKSPALINPTGGSIAAAWVDSFVPILSGNVNKIKMPEEELETSQNILEGDYNKAAPVLSLDVGITMVTLQDPDKDYELNQGTPVYQGEHDDAESANLCQYHTYKVEANDYQTVEVRFPRGQTLVQCDDAPASVVDRFQVKKDGE
ncbi:hypothetical protein FAUST_1435 [Fusarium austroamericanum]|uniref:Uncharacterized protein n=1 Tax=Fusarium austroamericanum TaxID=282268 RepID=A0AAN6C8Y0_FUSAU|nr:hypothetical protein FAUST_1435 [Fusarium austroamericanum]